jgi:hypothetical protein
MELSRNGHLTARHRAPIMVRGIFRSFFAHPMGAAMVPYFREWALFKREHLRLSFM